MAGGSDLGRQRHRPPVQRQADPAGPAVEESDEILVVEGRADVLNLLKHGFKNIIALANLGFEVPGLCVPSGIINGPSRIKSSL